MLAKQSTNTRILLLLSGYAKSGVGAQFIETMLSLYDKQHIWRYSIVIEETTLDSDYYGYPTVIRKAPYSYYPVLSGLRYWKFQKKQLDVCVEDVKTLIETHQIDVVWTVCNSSYNIAIAANLIDGISIPMIVQIWDTPEYFGKASRIGKRAMKDLLSNFGKVLTKAQYGVTISDSMGQIYKERYGLESTTMVFSSPLTSFPQSKALNTIGKESITIIFAGGLYAYKTWNSFLDAVEQRNNSDQSPKIKVRCIGNLSRWDKKRNWVQYEPIKPVAEAIQIVNEADIAYLPYWMDKKHAYTVKTAFPSKLSFYTSAGTPILYHGPKDSTPTEFLDKYHVGIACHSTSIERILECVDLLCSTAFRHRYIEVQHKIQKEVFHPDRMVEIFESALAKVMR